MFQIKFNISGNQTSLEYERRAGLLEGVLHHKCSLFAQVAAANTFQAFKEDCFWDWASRWVDVFEIAIRK